MDTQAFWDVIGKYNSATVYLQIILLLLVAAAVVISYTGKVKWLAKAALGVENLYIAICFFADYGTQPIQRYFALPLFALTGILLIIESFRNKEDALNKPTRFRAVLLALFLLYPAVSMALGNSFPHMVTHIMPCPVASLSIAVYAGYQKKNKLLLILLTLWGLTGVKSVLFQAYEDIILLICGIYGVYLTVRTFQRKNRESC